MSANNGGPAFPAPEVGQQHFSDPAAYPGMTLRDYFAAKALSAMDLQIAIAEPAARLMAASAYTVADAMLVERAKEQA